MKACRTATIAVLVMILLPNGAAARQQPARKEIDLAVRGMGNDSCAEWTTDRGKEETDRIAQVKQVARLMWVQGFVTGADALQQLYQKNPAPLKPTSNLSAGLWIANYCQANPLKQLFDAATELVKELQP